MPHSIFFHGGYAIHGSYEVSRLGGPASHGCVRLRPSEAATLFRLVQEHGKENTEIVVTGANPPVRARADRPRRQPAAEPFWGPFYAPDWGRGRRYYQYRI